MKVAVIGGDKRMLYAAKAFMDDGAEVALSGFDALQNDNTSVRDAVRWADLSILPVRPITDGYLTMPYSDTRMTIEEFAQICGKKPIFCGMSDSISKITDAPVYDYAAREDFAIKNAVLTAEGTLELLLHEYKDSLCGANVLVIGYGRIGKVLSRYLNALGAKVTVSARKASARAWIEAMGIKADDYSQKELNSYEIILNTVPALILDRSRIDRLRDDVLLIDLASAPGGVDFDRAKEREIRCIHALGLPGRSAPIAAGRIIKDTIIHIIKEENGGKENSGLCDDRLLLHL